MALCRTAPRKVLSAATADAFRSAARHGGSVTHLLAYIDPGSGSLIIQVVIATLVAIPIFFRAQLKRLIDAIRGTKEEKSPVDDVASHD
jgi:hypothetical protein